MAKLILLALAFTALVAFASAHTTTIVTTTIGDDNPILRRQCSPQLQGQSFNQCVRYLQQGQQQQQGHQQQQHHQGGQQQQLVQQCCQELQRVDEQCQCEAVQQVFQKVQRQQQQQQGQQGGRYGSQQLQGLKMRAQNLPNQCNLQVRQCPIRTIISTTTITQEDNPFGPFGPFGSRPQCSRYEVQGQSFNQCQRYIEQQVSGISPRTLLMSINRQGQGQSMQQVQQCCNELQNVRRECQCEAVREVYRQTTQQMQQGGRRGQQQQGGGQQEMRRVVRSVVENLPNECNLEFQQCQIPSSMF